VLGQHTEDVLSDWLGMSGAEVTELRRQEVV
jgi:crotonobetainyl-CoA:carnitine CoA-transferase CaiB-like acyl-CoA transferase